MTEARMKEVIENTRTNLELDWEHLTQALVLSLKIRELVLNLQIEHGVSPQVVAGIMETVQQQKDAVRKASGQVMLLRKALSEVE